MIGAFQGLNTLSSALEAFQAQLDVTGQNIANVNTPGYSEQQVNLSETPGSAETVGNTFEIGNGVNIQSVTRQRDMFLQASSNTAAAGLSEANEQVSTSSTVGTILYSTTSGGIGSDLDAFFNAWSGLASNPSSATKLTVQQTGQTLANDMQSAYGQLGSVKTSATQQIPGVLTQIQSYSNQIAQLNSQILSAQASGSSPNALMDQRDQTVQELSGLTNLSVQQQGNGAYVVSTGNLILVNQSGAQTVPTQFNAATGSLTDGTNSYSIQSGQLAGLFDSINKVNSYEGSLNTLANQLRTQVNGAYSTAKTSNGQTGALFFNSGSGAANFDLDSTGLAGPPPVAGVKNSPNAIATGTSGAASDVGVAQQLFSVGSTPTTALGNMTMTDYYAQLVGTVGQDGQNANNAQSTQQALNQQITGQIQSTSGVSLDDEMTNLLQYQKSYQAAAQAISALDQANESFLTSLAST